MGATRSGRMLAHARGLPARLALVVVALLAAGCGVPHTSSVLHAPAPLSPDVNICCLRQGSGYDTSHGLTALKGQDGTDAWHADTGNVGTLVQANGVIYGEGTSTQRAQPTLLAARLVDGHILWQVPLPFQTPSGAGSLALATDGEIVLLTDQATALYALDAATGAPRWHVDGGVAYRFVGQLAVGDGVAVALAPGAQENQAHLVVYQEDSGRLLWQGQDVRFDSVLTIGVNQTAVYLSAVEATSPPDPSALLAYNPHTGQQLWRSEIIGGIVAVTDQTVTLGNSSVGSVACVDAATGTLKWKSDAPVAQWYELSSSPTAIYIPSGTSKTQLVALSLADGTQKWRADFDRYFVGTALQEQGVVFVFLTAPQNYLGPTLPDRLVALDATTAKVYWERDMR